MAKTNIPIGMNGELDYTDESKYLNTLIYKLDRTTTGQSQFTSLSSNITYSTEDYPDDDDIYSCGEVGMIRLLQKLYGGQDGFLMMAEDYNNVVTVPLQTTLASTGWEITETEGIYKQSVANSAIHANSIITLEASYSEYAKHIEEPFATLFVDDIVAGQAMVYCICSDIPPTDYVVTLLIKG